MKSTNKTRAVVTGDCLSNACLFFDTPCLEYWLSLCQLAEGMVFSDLLVFLTHDSAKVKTSVFEKPFASELRAKGIVQLVPMGTFITHEAWARIFDRFVSALTTQLPQQLDDATCLELFDDVIRRLHFEGAAFHGTYHMWETSPDRYYEKGPPGSTAMWLLRRLSTRIALVAFTEEVGVDLVDDPLAVSRATDIYAKGIARLNYLALRKVVGDRLAASVPGRDLFTLSFSPLSALALNRACQRKTSFLEEVLELRQEFTTYRQKMGGLISLDLSGMSVEEFLRLRHKFIEEVQTQLEQDWKKTRTVLPLLESVDASISEEINVSCSVTALLKMVAKGIKSTLIRARVKPLFRVSEAIKQLPLVDDSLRRLFDWEPSRAACARVTKFLGKDHLRIPDRDFLDQAKKDFLAFHGTLPKECKFRI